MLLWRQLAATPRLPDTGCLPRTGLNREPQGPPRNGPTSEGMPTAHFQSVSQQPLGLRPAHLHWVIFPLASKGANAHIPESTLLLGHTCTRCPRPSPFCQYQEPVFLPHHQFWGACHPVVTHAGRATEMGSVASSKEGHIAQRLSTQALELV